MSWFNNEREVKTSMSKEDILEAMEYGTGDAKHQANQQFPLDEKHLACITNSTESWFKNQSLLIYNNYQIIIRSKLK